MVSRIVFGGDDDFLFTRWILVLLLMAVMYVFLLTGWLLCVYVFNANANLCKNNENYQTIYGSTPDYNPETSLRNSSSSAFKYVSPELLNIVSNISLVKNL